MKKKLGKLEHRLFERCIKEKCGAHRPEVRVGPEFGVDVSVTDIGNGLSMALTSDPLSLIPSLGLQESAWLSVTLLANDMATTGFTPMYAQFVLNLPAAFPKPGFENYWEHVHKYCSDLNIAITGGHTGFIEGQNSTIAGGGTFITVAPSEQILVSKYAATGDSLLVTKSASLSSSSILALSFPETVKNKVGKEIFQKACDSFFQTLSLPDAQTAVSGPEGTSLVTAMHDVTEGGVLGAIYELAVASGNGALVFNEKIPIGEVQSAICDVFSLDARYSIGAGSMIITCKPENEQKIVSRLAEAGIPCTPVGVLTDPENGIKLVTDGQAEELKYIEEDPYWAAFFRAYNSGWR